MYIKTRFGTFEWDNAKAESNFRKHGLKFEEAIRLFGGICTETIDTRKDYGETRKISIGLVKGTLITTVVHTSRSGTRRIISARRANEKERTTFAAFIERSDREA